ncbi:hypothetical protein C8R44DRAFT_748412 [Mycena epipterygia]|nr:hypothetical protein C8R44DRAFT_748412 [Mycena epipterygia]
MNSVTTGGWGGIYALARNLLGRLGHTLRCGRQRSLYAYRGCTRTEIKFTRAEVYANRNLREPNCAYHTMTRVSAVDHSNILHVTRTVPWHDSEIVDNVYDKIPYRSLPAAGWAGQVEFTRSLDSGDCIPAVDHSGRQTLRYDDSARCTRTENLATSGWVGQVEFTRYLDSGDCIPAVDHPIRTYNARFTPVEIYVLPGVYAYKIYACHCKLSMLNSVTTSGWGGVEFNRQPEPLDSGVITFAL